VGYATGQTDEWRGTGVWSGLSLKRESGENKNDSDEGKSSRDVITKSTDKANDSPK
jgi:hypothetical protein